MTARRLGWVARLLLCAIVIVIGVYVQFIAPCSVIASIPFQTTAPMRCILEWTGK